MSTTEFKLAHHGVSPSEGSWQDRVFQVTFGVLVGGLTVLLILLYAGVPIVGM
jgi:hypothetical protein